MYYYGEDIPKNIDKAIELYKQSANNKFSRALRELGRMYMIGENVIKDTKIGIDYLYKSA